MACLGRVLNVKVSYELKLNYIEVFIYKGYIRYSATRIWYTTTFGQTQNRLDDT